MPFLPLCFPLQRKLKNKTKQTGGVGPLESGGCGVPSAGTVRYTEHKSSVIEQISIYIEDTGSQASCSLRRDLHIEKATMNPRH